MLEKLTRKAENNPKYSLGEMTDIFAGRIIVSNLSKLTFFDQLLTKKLKKLSKLIERDNVYGKSRGDIYRVINYLFDAGDGMIVELQLKTMANACGSEIYHNIAYKPNIYPKLNTSVREAVTNFAWRMVNEDLLNN